MVGQAKARVYSRNYRLNKKLAENVPPAKKTRGKSEPNADGDEEVCEEEEEAEGYDLLDGVEEGDPEEGDPESPEYSPLKKEN